VDKKQKNAKKTSNFSLVHFAWCQTTICMARFLLTIIAIATIMAMDEQLKLRLKNEPFQLYVLKGLFDFLHTLICFYFRVVTRNPQIAILRHPFSAMITLKHTIDMPTYWLRLFLGQ